jgi:hypothetical protein
MEIIDASSQVNLEVSTEKTKYMLLSHHQNAGQSYVLMYDHHKFLNLITVEHGEQMVETCIYVISEVLLVMNIKFVVFWNVPL